MKIYLSLILLLVGVDVLAQEGGACPRLERKRIGACGISVADPCHSGSQCVCMRCGERRVQDIPEIIAGQCVSSREVCRPNGPEIPPTCTTVCDRYAPPSCRVVRVNCQVVLETVLNPAPHTCTEPCPPCPDGFRANCEDIPCGPSSGTCP